MRFNFSKAYDDLPQEQEASDVGRTFAKLMKTYNAQTK